MYNHTLYFAFWCTNVIVLYLSQFVIPNGNVVIGSWRFNSFESSIYAGFWLTFLYWVWWGFEMQRGLKSDNKVVSFFVYIIINSLAIWAVSVFHYIFGFQLLNYSWALVIGLAATILQTVAWRIVVKHEYSVLG